LDHRRRPETLRTAKAAVESHSNLTNLGINAIDGANVAVVNLFVVVVLDLHHLVASRKGPAKSLNFFVACEIKNSRRCRARGWLFDLSVPDWT
jgi:hypothetical protein